MAAKYQIALVTILIATLVINTCAQKAKGGKKDRRPNIVIFLADDLGIGDIGCFGNDTIRTPNIDSICTKGAKLSHHVAAAAVCTPSRAALLTGRYPIRSGMAAEQFMPALPFVGGRGGLPENETTFGKFFQERGYKTGLIGKWHLGMNREWNNDFLSHPNTHGFGYFFGTPMSLFKNLSGKGESVLLDARPNVRRNALTLLVVGLITAYIMRRMGFRIVSAILFLMMFIISIPMFYMFSGLAVRTNSLLMRNKEVVEMPMDLNYMTERLALEAINFLEQRQKDKEPFLLYVPWMQVHTPMHASKRFHGTSQHGSYGDEVEEMDWGTGVILQALDDLGLNDNTLVYFSSDNGGHLEEKDYLGNRAGGHNGIYRGSKTQSSMEGGTRMPSAIMWPGKIPAGIEITEPTSQMDILPTLAGIINAPVPPDRVIDGQDMMPLLQGKQKVSSHEFLWHYCGAYLYSATYRPRTGTDVYKLHWAMPKWLPGTQSCGFICICHADYYWLDKPILFNLAKDPSETNELDISDPKYAKIVKTFNQAREEHKGTLQQVPPQFSYSQLVWRPWLQPYCKFPWLLNCVDLDNPLKTRTLDQLRSHKA